jgi:hypothetical protein
MLRDLPSTTGANVSVEFGDRGRATDDPGRGPRGHRHGPRAALAGLDKGFQGGCVPRIRYFAGLNATSFRRFSSASMSVPS